MIYTIEDYIEIMSGVITVDDQVFDFDDARLAFHALGSNDHFGKIVIRNG